MAMAIIAQDIIAGIVGVSSCIGDPAINRPIHDLQSGIETSTSVSQRFPRTDQRFWLRTSRFLFTMIERDSRPPGDFQKTPYF
jgi:hypothetical protein